MPDPSSSPPLRPPKQARSRRTLERIVQASLAILDEGGPEELTVQAVVRRAGSSVGSFYARFGGKEDLLDYLGDRVWEDALARWDVGIASKTWSDMELRQMAEGAAGLLFDAHRSRSVYLRALDRVGGGRDGYERFRQRILTGLESLLLERRNEMAHDEPELAVRVGLRGVMGVIDGLSADPDGVARERIVGECRDLLVTYLTGGAFRGGPEGEVDFFDIWDA